MHVYELTLGSVTGSLADRLGRRAAGWDYSPAARIAGELGPEQLAGMAGREVEADAIGQFTGAAADLEEVDPRVQRRQARIEAGRLRRGPLVRSGDDS
jgi:hypothetical protein